MRLLLALSLVLGGCVLPTETRTTAQVRKPVGSAERLTWSADVVKIHWAGDSRLAFAAAARALVEAGLEVTALNADARLMSAKVERVDEWATEELERERLRIVKTLPPDAYPALLRRRSPLLESVVVLRRVTLSVSTASLPILISPRIERCHESPRGRECAPQSHLLEEEVILIGRIAGSLKKMAPAETSPPNLSL